MRDANKMDWSTINLKKLESIEEWEVPFNRTLSASCGVGCSGDPPGYPSYFLRSVYDASGNSPMNGPNTVISHPSLGNRPISNKDSRLRSIWLPLSIDHQRTKAWILSKFSRLNHCYVRPGIEWKTSRDIIIYPPHKHNETPFGKMRWLEFEIENAKNRRDFDKWEFKHEESFVRDILDSNNKILELFRQFATPDNHAATVAIRKYYPEFNPTDELIAAEYDSPGNWWETLSDKPTPEDCPGQYMYRHPVGKDWCQFCGWRKELV